MVQTLPKETAERLPIVNNLRKRDYHLALDILHEATTYPGFGIKPDDPLVQQSLRNLNTVFNKRETRKGDMCYIYKKLVRDIQLRGLDHTQNEYFFSIYGKLATSLTGYRDEFKDEGMTLLSSLIHKFDPRNTVAVGLLLTYVSKTLGPKRAWYNKEDSSSTSYSFSNQEMCHMLSKLEALSDKLQKKHNFCITSDKVAAKLFKITMVILSRLGRNDEAESRFAAVLKTPTNKQNADCAKIFLDLQRHYCRFLIDHCDRYEDAASYGREMFNMHMTDRDLAEASVDLNFLIRNPFVTEEEEKLMRGELCELAFWVKLDATVNHPLPDPDNLRKAIDIIQLIH
ncbi:uncharacterized protein LOC118437111 [Folsomia candida]|nr:uncharacterized protein LOC118437111 [Folsomia candida]